MTDNESKRENEDGSNNEKTNEIENVSRRKFLKSSGIAAGGVVGGALLGSLLGNPFKSEPSTKVQPLSIDYGETRQFFKRKSDFDILNFATETIYPEDEHGAGAIKLGVPYYIDKQLASPWGQNAEDYMSKPFIKKDQTSLNRGEVFLRGLRKLNEVAQKEHEDEFKNLEAEKQIELLKKFEADEVKMEFVSSAYFFELLRQTTLEGCYCDPMYGGNKNMEGWKMKEFPGARLSYTDYVEEEDFVALDPVSLKTQTQ